MPFTFAHPAFCIPLRYLPRSWFSFTGLITGSIVPDLEYIVNSTRTFSHTYQAILWFHLPTALVVAFLFHNILRDKLISRLPAFMHSRFTRFEGFNWWGYFKKNTGIIIFSIILGAVSHLFWDNPVMTENVFTMGTFMPLHVLVWNVSSIAGVLALMIAIYFLPNELKKRQYSIVWFWIFIMVCAALLSFLLLIKVENGDITAIYINFLRAGLLVLLLIAFLKKKKMRSSKTRI